MLSRKALARINAPLTLSEHVVHLPIRRVIALNAAEQLCEGFGYVVPGSSWEALDAILNFSLHEDFRAPTPKQTRFISYIADQIGIPPTDEEMGKKKAGERYIERYCNDLPFIVGTKENNEQ